MSVNHKQCIEEPKFQISVFLNREVRMKKKCRKLDSSDRMKKGKAWNVRNKILFVTFKKSINCNLCSELKLLQTDCSGVSKVHFIDSPSIQFNADQYSDFLECDSKESKNTLFII